MPAIGVMTSRFVGAAELTARALARPGYRFAVIVHPISSILDAKLEAYARATIEQARWLQLRASGRRREAGANRLSQARRPS